MNEMQVISQTTEKPIKKELVTQYMVILSGYLGGPLAACYFVGRNYKALGNFSEAKKWYLWGAISRLY